METYLYYAAVFIVAAGAGASRTVHNGRFKSLGNLASVAFVSGFLAFGVVAIIEGDIDRPNFNPVYYVGVSSIIGLAGKEQTELIRWSWKLVFGILQGVLKGDFANEND